MTAYVELLPFLIHTNLDLYNNVISPEEKYNIFQIWQLLNLHTKSFAAWMYELKILFAWHLLAPKIVKHT